MGMMTRRNMKNRATTSVAPSSKKEEIKKEERFSEFDYTKTEINRMSTNDLKNLAISLFLPNAEYMNGAELKRVLIEHFNL